MSTIIILFYLFFNFFSLRYPIFSFIEMENVPMFILKIIPPDLFWVLRIIPLFLITFSYLILIKNYKNKTILLLFIFSTPWVFVLSREFNWIPLLFLLSLIASYSLKSSKKNILTYIFLLFLFYFYNKNVFYQFVDKLNSFKNYLNFVSFFFQGESISSYLRIPKFAYFLHFTLILFIYGLFNTDFKKIHKLLIFSIIFYFILPQNQFIFTGVGFLFVFQLIIINGLIKINNKKLILILIILNFLNFCFFLEMYFRHYQKKFSHEREFARINLVSFLKNFPDKNIIITEDEKIKRIIKIYSFHYQMPSVKYINFDLWHKTLKNCYDSKIICVLDEKIIYNLKLNKDDKKFYSISNDDGIRVFYLLTK